MTTPIDYILILDSQDPQQNKLIEVMHGTPDRVNEWLDLMPEAAPSLFVKDTVAGLVVTAHQYVEKLKTGEDYKDVPVKEYTPPVWVW